MELNKRKAELEFQKKVLGHENESEMRVISKAIAELSCKVAGTDIVVPYQDSLDSLQKVLESFSPSEIRESLKIRDGKVYAALAERGRIVKRNFENRLEIAKLSLIIAKLSPEERAPFASAVRKGSIDSPLQAKSIDESLLKTASRLMTRCAMPAAVSGHIIQGAEAETVEVRMEVSNRSIWIDKSLRPKLEENLKKMTAVNSLIQLRNAERQIKSFSDAEENGFSDLQRQYLELLKEQDEILRAYNEEEKVSSS